MDMDKFGLFYIFQIKIICDIEWKHFLINLMTKIKLY